MPRDPLAILLLVVAAVALAALWAQALRPIVAWDADVYHLTIPRLYLEHGGFRRIPFNVYSNWPLGVQLLYALAMVVKDYVLATALHFGFGVVLIAVVGMAAARATTPLWGTIAAASLLLHPVFLFEIRVAYVDVACAFFLFAAFLALHRALDDAGEERRWLVLSGIACGVLAAAKLNGFFGALCIATVYLVSRLRGGTPPRALVKPLLAFAAPVIVLVSPWVAKSLLLTGNPVYPLLFDVFGGPEWSSALGAAHRSWQRAIGMGRSPLDLVLLPVRVLFLGAEGYEHFDGRLHPLLGVLLPIALFGLRGQKIAAPRARRRGNLVRAVGGELAADAVPHPRPAPARAGDGGRPASSERTLAAAAEAARRLARADRDRARGPSQPALPRPGAAPLRRLLDAQR